MFQQGDIVSVNFPFSDDTIRKKRPALIISNHRVNHTGDYLHVQITSKVKNDELSLRINKGDYVKWELPLRSFVRFHKIFLLNEALILRKVSSVKIEYLKSVTTKIEELIKWEPFTY
jgi:mRNA interferase MazF